METWELAQEHQECLLNQTETGMGYQVFNDNVKDVDSVIISNCRFGTMVSSRVSKNAVKTSIPDYKNQNHGLADLVFFDRLKKFKERVYNSPILGIIVRYTVFF